MTNFEISKDTKDFICNEFLKTFHSYGQIGNQVNLTAATVRGICVQTFGKDKVNERHAEMIKYFKPKVKALKETGASCQKITEALGLTKWQLDQVCEELTTEACCEFRDKWNFIPVVDDSAKDATFSVKNSKVLAQSKEANPVKNTTSEENISSVNASSSSKNQQLDNSCINISLQGVNISIPAKFSQAITIQQDPQNGTQNIIFTPSKDLSHLHQPFEEVSYATQNLSCSMQANTPNTDATSFASNPSSISNSFLTSQQKSSQSAPSLHESDSAELNAQKQFNFAEQDFVFIDGVFYPAEPFTEEDMRREMANELDATINAPLNISPHNTATYPTSVSYVEEQNTQAYIPPNKHTVYYATHEHEEYSMETNACCSQNHGYQQDFPPNCREINSQSCSTYEEVNIQHFPNNTSPNRSINNDFLSNRQGVPNRLSSFR